MPQNTAGQSAPGHQRMLREAAFLAELTNLRADLQELTSSSLSLMPEGLEAAFKPEDLADLIAFIKAAGRGGK